MFNKKKLLFALFLISCIFISMSFVSANNITDVDSDSLSQNNHDSSSKSFKDLDKEINGDLNKSEIILNDDYINTKDNNFHLHGLTSGIFINRSVIIDGQGHEIDANYSSRIFHINADNVVLKNIVFKNCHSNASGAVYCNGTNITIINSTFIKNWILDSDGAAINFKYDGMIINSTFINNTKYEVIRNGTMAEPCEKINETIIYEINCDDVYNIVSFEKNYNVTIINSTFNDGATPLWILDPNLITPRWDNESEWDVPNDPSGPRWHFNITNNTNTSKVFINKSSVNVFAKNKVFNKKLKTKLYPVVLKSKNGKVLKNALITLKIKGKLFKAKTNGKGKATFKITKFNKKGNFKGVVKFDGNEKYNKFSKKVKIVIK